MKIALIGHLKFPIAKPYAGGLEAFTHAYARSFVEQGHDVTLFCAGDSDPDLPINPIVDQATVQTSRERFGQVDNQWVESVEDDTYQALMAKLLMSGFDVVHNHSLNPIPLEYASLLPCPMITTLHAPPLKRMVEALRSHPQSHTHRFVNISRANAKAWAPTIGRHPIIRNGVDTDFWRRCASPKVDRAIWFGRIVPDKGADYAIRAAHKAGLPIDVVGPIGDEDYFYNLVAAELGRRDVYHGHKTHEELCQLISRSRVALVTPCWDEPFGLVAAEALACGTPVAGFARGALPELIRGDVGRLAEAGNTKQLADAVGRCRDIPGERCREVARERFGFERVVRQYESLYNKTLNRIAA